MTRSCHSPIQRETTATGRSRTTRRPAAAPPAAAGCCFSLGRCCCLPAATAVACGILIDLSLSRSFLVVSVSLSWLLVVLRSFGCVRGRLGVDVGKADGTVKAFASYRVQHDRLVADGSIVVGGRSRPCGPRRRVLLTLDSWRDRARSLLQWSPRLDPCRGTFVTGRAGTWDR